MFKVCRDDMPCEVKKNHYMGSFGGVLKKWKNSLDRIETCVNEKMMSF